MPPHSGRKQHNMPQPISSGYLGDATGGIGQGLAYVLPEGKADAYAMQLAQTHGNQLQEMARQKALQQQATQKQYETDFRNAELPKVWGPFADEINKRHSDLLAEAAGDWAKTGKSPWSSPDFTNKYNEQVTGLAAKANQFGEELTKRLAASRADKDGKLSEDSKKSLDDFYKGFLESKDKTGYLDKDMPDLKDRDFTVDDVAKVLKAVPKTVDTGDYEDTGADRKSHEDQAYSTVVGDPKYAPLLAKYGVHAGGPDTTAYVYDKDAEGNNINSTGKRVFPTDQNYADYMANEWIHDPNKEKDLATMGVSKDDPYAVQKIAHYITDRNSAMGKLVSDIADKKDAEVPSVHKYTGKETAERDRQFNQQEAVKRLGIEGQRLRDEEQWHKDAQAVKSQPDYVANTIYGGDRTKSLESLNAISQLYKNNASYGQGLQHIHDDGQTVSFTIPPKKVKNPNYVFGYKGKYAQPEYKEATPPVNVVLHRSAGEMSFNAGIFDALKNVGGASANKFIQDKGMGSDRPTAKKQITTGSLNNL